MKSLILAIALNEEKTLFKDHFGDAPFFHLYRLNESEITYLKEINNTSPEEKIHADPKKAKGIKNLLSEVDVLVGKAMGLNIKRMKTDFVTVISRKHNPEEILYHLQLEFDKLLDAKTQMNKTYFVR